MEAPISLASEMAPATTASTVAATRERGVTPRVVIISLLLAVCLGYAIPVIDYKLMNTFLDAQHLPPGAVGALLILVIVINPLLRLLSGRLGFSRNEALTVYITCLFSSLMPGHGAENFVIPNLLASFYLATRNNKWLDFLLPYTKPWMTPAVTTSHAYNRAVVEGWYVGTGTAPVPWAAWLVPLAAWMSFVVASYVMLGCLSVMLRAQWAEHEALAFPLLRLPLEMTEDLDRTDKYGVVSRFFRNPMMWTGFIIAVFIQTQRGLHVYFPDVPDFPLDINVGPLLTDPPWNQIGWFNVAIFPIAVGISFLLTSEVSFSLVFFFWFMQFQLMAAYQLGFAPKSMPDAAVFPGKIFAGYQMGGCYLAYVAIVLWTGREHFMHIGRRAFGRAAAQPNEKQEVLSYPLAFWGFVLAFAFMMAWSMCAGVRCDIALALWGGYIVAAIGLTRVAVEGGLLALLHDSAPLGAVARLLNSGPSNWLTLENGLVPASFLQAGLVVHMRGFSMPSFIQSFKLAYDRKIEPKPLGLLIVAVILITVTMSWTTIVRMGYQNGGLQFGHKWYAQQGSLWPAHFVDATTKATTNTAWVNWLWLFVGAALTYGMMLARSRLPIFPFHPLGYLMSLAFPIRMFWFSVFLGWLCKVLITRFGGIDSYRKAVPLFLGLALGDVTMILIWLVIDGWQGRTGHQLLPG
ncbi:MAG: hypothetical protein JOZ57_16950 [Abitibacteriaceae bacterium]|nr:hypothetical protein [Abditibacteriaceae bacterium]